MNLKLRFLSRKTSFSSNFVTVPFNLSMILFTYREKEIGRRFLDVYISSQKSTNTSIDFMQLDICKYLLVVKESSSYPIAITEYGNTIRVLYTLHFKSKANRRK